MQDPSSKRPYVSPARRAMAEATRTRILDAAARLFLDNGYARTSTAAVGQAAGTSEASVFAVFGSKAGLLLDVISDQVGRDADFPLAGHPVWMQFVGAPDPGRALAEFARVARRAHERSWRLLAIASAAAEGDPQVARAVAAGADRRLHDVRWFLHRVIGLREAEIGQKADEMWTLVGVDNYRRLVVDRGWSPQQYEEWLARALVATIQGAG